MTYKAGTLKIYYEDLELELRSLFRKETTLREEAEQIRETLEELRGSLHRRHSFEDAQNMFKEIEEAIVEENRVFDRMTEVEAAIRETKEKMSSTLARLANGETSI
ncbi:hypothetical protein K461DRAFT_272083 [Myriangium duriaei CBS 260.36]|uniref:Uncharacterized protein n=1 Tax=Myriangium duriaei CBS 260.36 TaxID=1168546 RepID=A0A9P4IU94_9PEZI|nr:hypothetical protein K461DRAFT_272083 [Myriangium duriaei CBS 260.36]